jgi:phosphatidate phosphatase APP1
VEPPGALLLTDWGPTPTRWFRDGRAHKRASLQRLAEDLPGVRWTLLGDTGEHDPALYEEFARARPDRVRAVLLREVDGGPARVERFGPVPVVYARDGDAIAGVLPAAD